MGTCQFQIIVIVVIVRKILSYTRGLTKKLQSIDRDLPKVTSDIKLLKKTLKDRRENIDLHHEIWHQESLTLSKEVDVKESIKRKRRPQRYRDNYDEGIEEEYYKKSLSIPFLDQLITELDTRFSSDAVTIYNCFFLVPAVMFSNGENSSNFGIGSTWRRNGMIYL